MFQEDVLERLRIDPGQRTLGQLLQDRQAAAHEIRKLRSEIERLRTVREGRKERAGTATPETRAFRPGSLIRIREVCDLVGVCRATVYRRVSEDAFPHPVRISERAVRWDVNEIEAWREAL
jgi:predicted DNA-binding transcriptional regulator AlpA